MELPVKINEYLFLEEIGSGGFSRVYKVKSERYGTIFAAKMITFDCETNERVLESYENEIAALKKLDHPNVIQLYSYFTDKNRLVLILEYCEKGTLADYLCNNEGIKYDHMLYMCRQILDALDYCHSQCIAHRDIKPSNILIDSFGRPKLSDFGLSVELNSRDRITNGDCSMFYAPPEVLKRISHSPFEADVWSLGVVFYLMFVGELPWPVSSFEGAKESILLGLFSVPPSDHPEFSSIIKKMIVLNPNKRITIRHLKENSLFSKKCESSLSCGGSLRKPGTIIFKPKSMGRIRFNSSVLVHPHHNTKPILSHLSANLTQNILV